MCHVDCEAIGEGMEKFRHRRVLVGHQDDGFLHLGSHEHLANRLVLVLLHSFTNGLTINMAHVMSSELSHLAEMLLNIYQVSGSTVEWISALVEDEIDGVHKESTANRLRYTSRIHSNITQENSQEREPPNTAYPDDACEDRGPWLEANFHGTRG
jgi:hypothetical protein